MKTSRWLPLLITLGLAAPVAFALDWSTKLISVTPEVGAPEVWAKFEFKNAGRAPVQIMGITTSCGCTEATPSATTIAAGGTGAIYVLFTVGSRSGLQEKKISVQTDESPDPVTLEFKIKLPDGAPKKAATPATSPVPAVSPARVATRP